jgi:hypothetical protein
MFAYGVVVMREITRWRSAFGLRNTEGCRSSQTEIVALGGSSKAESETKTPIQAETAAEVVIGRSQIEFNSSARKLR